MDMRIGEWGGSYAVRLPASVVEALKLQKGQPLDFSVQNGALTLTPKSAYPTLQDLCAIARKQTPPSLTWEDDILSSEWSNE